MSGSSARDTREFIKALRAVGYDVHMGKSGHWKVYLEGALVFTLPASASDVRWRKNKITEMRRRGLPLPVRTRW